MAKIFISYRRTDTQQIAGRISERLEKEFGKNNVFMDVDRIPPGVDFQVHVDDAISQADNVLVLIGPGWAEARDESGQLRLYNPHDFVRIEVETALKQNGQVVPVLVGAQMPRPDQLPENLRPLLRRNAANLDPGRDFNMHMDRLVNGLKSQPVSRSVPQPRVRVGGAAVLFLALFVAVWFGAPALGPWLQHEAHNTKDADGTTKVDADRVRHEENNKRVAELADQLKHEQEARQKAEADAEAARQKQAALYPDKGQYRVEDNVRQDPALSVTPGSGRSVRDRLVNGQECTMCPEMVVVPAGSFIMGSPESEEERFANESPQHKVTIAKPFAVGKFPLTFEEWDACVADGGCGGYKPDDQRWGRERRPVINVSWDDAQGYVKWLKEKTGKAYRLLSEAEREYATRAGTTTAYSTGPSITKQQAQFSEGSWGNAGKSAAVGSFPANRFGLHDMHGNVWEWVEDCWNDNYTGAPADGSAWTTGDCSRHVRRGGSWSNDSKFLRSAGRGKYDTSLRYYVYGFRLARAL